ncbi:MAG: 1-deoxy-D-xylulose-5-phosphate reductoisomerase [Deltaproteobacteria bacterium RBG_16_54_18]|nr:MAG: 1-deoxy-D-xylulose-5-phosphate reductoisomerase [Deltaproteobacteria bacterium RBG_16_54_18]
MKQLAILGSTGSIGVNTLEVVKQFREEFEVCSLAAAGKNLALLREQIKEFRPRLVAVRDHERAHALREALAGERIEVVSGVEGLIQAATVAGVELVVLSVVGAIGIHPLLAAIEAGTNVALANKEAIVTAGEIVMKKAQANGVAILPIDSEHSAIFQALGGRLTGEGIKRIVLTASGGPFYTVPVEALIKVSPQQAIAHPVWAMGPKISVDSATMMNKGLEVIEAHWLFHVPSERIEVAIHPQGVVHSLVEYVDGSLIAQLSIPDMRIPISYALAYPKRLAMELPALDLAQLNHLTFDPPDEGKFPCLRLAYEALAHGGTMPAVLNAANEAAVGAFLQGQISFNQIPQVVASTMDDHRPSTLEGVEDALAAEQWAKGRALDVIREVSQ